MSGARHEWEEDGGKDHAWCGKEEFPAVAGFLEVFVVCVLYNVVAGLFQ